MSSSCASSALILGKVELPALPVPDQKVSVSHIFGYRLRIDLGHVRKTAISKKETCPICGARALRLAHITPVVEAREIVRKAGVCSRRELGQIRGLINHKSNLCMTCVSCDSACGAQNLRDYARCRGVMLQTLTRPDCPADATAVVKAVYEKFYSA